MDATFAVALVAVTLLAAAAALAVRARLGAPRGAGARPSDRTAQARAQAALEDTRSQGRVLLERARSEAVRQREAALDEVRAREGALEAVDRRLAARHFEITERRTAADERRAALEARRGAVAAERERLAAEAASVGERLTAVAALSREDAAAQVLARIGGELAADHPGRLERAV